MDQNEVISKIQELSNQIHRRTLRGGAELVLLSERVYEVLESKLQKNLLFERFHVIQPSEWGDPPKAPCDIRAIYFGGNLDYKFIEDNEEVSYGDNLEEEFQSQTEYSEEDGYEPLDIPDIDIQYVEDGVDDVVEEYTFE